MASWKESELYGKFIGITPFFNPGRHQNKVDNFRRFHENLEEQGLQVPSLPHYYYTGNRLPLSSRDASSSMRSCSAWSLSLGTHHTNLKLRIARSSSNAERTRVTLFGRKRGC